MSIGAAGLVILTALFVLWTVWLVASTRKLRLVVDYHVNFITAVHDLQDTIRGLDPDSDRAKPIEVLRGDYLTRMQIARQHAAGDADLMKLLDDADAKGLLAFTEPAARRKHVRGTLDRLATAVDFARIRMGGIANELAVYWRLLASMALISCCFATLLALLIINYRRELARRRDAETSLQQRNDELQAAIAKLQAAADEIKTLRGLIPICSCCKKIRDDQGFWQVLESYVSTHTEARFSHGLCPSCYRIQLEEVYKLYPHINPANELVDVIDEAGNTTGVVPRREMREKRLPHRCTYVLVFNERGELFIHQRTANKDVFPSYWDVCVGGVLAAGESFGVGAIREVKEELGIIATPVELFPFFYEDSVTFAHGMAYRLDHDGPFQLQVDEIVQGEFVPVQIALERTKRELFCPDGVQVLEKYLASPLAPSRSP